MSDYELDLDQLTDVEDLSVGETVRSLGSHPRRWYRLLELGELQGTRPYLRRVAVVEQVRGRHAGERSEVTLSGDYELDVTTT